MHGLGSYSVIVATLGLSLGSSIPAVAAPRLTCATDRSTYRFGEPVWLYVTVGNAGTAPLHVENPHCSRTSTRIEIENEKGVVLPMSGPPSCSTTYLEEIVPGQEMIFAFELLEYYGVDGGGEFPYGMLPTGTYRVRYRTHDTASTPLEFSIAPLDPADVETFHAYVAVLDDTSPDDLRTSTDRFRAFVAKHPYSPFAAALLCRAGVVSDLFFDSAQALRDFRRLIELYPDSGYVSVAVRHLAFGMGADLSEGIAYLRRVPDELPGTLAAEFATRVLARLDASRGVRDPATPTEKQNGPPGGGPERTWQPYGESNPGFMAENHAS